MCWLRSTSQQPWKAWQLQSYFAGEKAESQSHTGQWVCPELAVLGPWVCNAVNLSHLERLRLRDEASVHLCAMEGSRAELQPQALAQPIALHS